MWSLYCLFHSFESGRIAASFRGQLLGTDLPGKLGEAFTDQGLGAGAGHETVMGKEGPVPSSWAILPLSPLRYQEVQAAQKALGMAMAEVLPEAQSVLASVQQVCANTTLHLISLAAPAAQVSMGQGQGRMWLLANQCRPDRGRSRDLFLTL